MGLGTGGYKSDSSGGWGSYPECWAESGGCGPWVVNATTQYLQVARAGGETLVRIDNGNSYQDVASIAAGMVASGLPRDAIFLLTKLGDGFPMGCVGCACTRSVGS